MANKKNHKRSWVRNIPDANVLRLEKPRKAPQKLKTSMKLKRKVRGSVSGKLK